MNRIAVAGLSGLGTGALYGAIGASVGGAAPTSPVLKGAAVSGLIGGTLATITTAILVSQLPEEEKAAALSGVPVQGATLNGARGVYFP